MGILAPVPLSPSRQSTKLSRMIKFAAFRDTRSPNEPKSEMLHQSSIFPLENIDADIMIYYAGSRQDIASAIRNIIYGINRFP
jgi:hypothetical protein